MIQFKFKPQELFQGCVLAALAHAVTAGDYPELSYEHSWDGLNYSVNNSQGCRGTVTFHDKYIIGVIRDEAKTDRDKYALDFFRGAQKDIKHLAELEALQYVLDDVDGITRPIITTDFWGTWENLYSNDTFSEFINKGGYILENQLLNFRQAMKKWNDYYEFNHGQKELISSLFAKKIKNGLQHKILLNRKEIDMLSGDLAQCRESLNELNITF